LTHGHIDAILAAGYYAAFIANIVSGDELDEAATKALALLREREGHEEVSSKIEKALSLATNGMPAMKAMDSIGVGYTADEAAALAVFVCIRYRDDFDGAILAATTFDGNRDSIAPIVGNALGVRYGIEVLPPKWIAALELQDLLSHGADLLLERVDIEDIPVDI
jgi:ADP-ribosylglycohydrolase